jgi:replicative DNA helicase
MSIRTKLSDLGISDRTGGDDYLIELQDTAIVPAHVTFYSRKILEKFRRREIIEAASSVLNDAYDDDDISTALEKIQSIGICDAGERRKPQIISEAKDLSDKMSIGHAVGIPTPFAKFNRKTFGLPRGVVCPLAGRGGKGKSMLKSYLTSSFIMQGIPTLDFCLEDGDVKSANRLAACIGEYDLFRLNRGNVSSEYMATHNKCLDQIGSLPYFPHQDGGTVEDIVIKIGRFMRENESSIRSSGGIVFIDGIKDVIASKGENKTSQEEHISQTLARCAVKHRDITIIPVSHLTKLDEGVWITLNDIRGSALQVANARAALIFQDSGFDAETNAAANFDENTVVLEMAKSNYGNPGRVILRKEFERGRFTEVSND